MEALIILAIIIVLLIIAGISAEAVMLGILGLMALGMLLLTVFFAFCILRLIRCEKTEGKLAKVEYHPKLGYGTPHYEVDGEVYANVFPCEVVMKKRLYTVGRVCRLRFDKKRRKVFDGNAVISSAAGLFLSGGSLYMILSQIISMFGGTQITLFR